MGKWQPPHPAKVIAKPLTCDIGQRFANVDRAMQIVSGPLASLTHSLRFARCSWCQGGIHIVTADELHRYRKALTEVERGG